MVYLIRHLGIIGSIPDTKKKKKLIFGMLPEKNTHFFYDNHTNPSEPRGSYNIGVLSFKTFLDESWYSWLGIGINGKKEGWF